MGCATTPLGQAVQGTAGGAVVFGAGVGTGLSTVVSGATIVAVAAATDTNITVPAALGVAGGAAISAVLLGVGGAILASSADGLDDYARRQADADRVQFEKLAKPTPKAKRATRSPAAPPPAPAAPPPPAADEGDLRSVAGVEE